MSLVVEAILYNRLTFSGWSAICGKRKGSSGSGGTHIPMDSISEGNPTNRFFGGSNEEANDDGEINISAESIGSAAASGPLTFRDWGGGREQWVIGDQWNNRHPAIARGNGIPGYHNAQLWNSGRSDKGNWLEKLVVYIARCSDGKYYMGYHVGEDLPAEWPSAKAKAGSGGRIGYIESNLNLTEVAEDVLDSFGKRKNVLICGPPGTGKTLALTRLIKALEDPDRLEWLALDPTSQSDPFSRESAGSLPMEEPVYSDWITFHQRTTYEEFVAGLRPKPGEDGVRLEPRAGRLLEAIRAVELGEYEAAVLFIDEINRGNTAAVLGEFITFLEPSKRDIDFYPTGIDAASSADKGDAASEDGEDADPASEEGQEERTQKIRFNREIGDRSYLDSLSYPITVPKELYIVGTMNALDRSVAPLDQALARRFQRVDAAPDFELLKEKLDPVSEDPDFDKLAAEDGADDTAFHLLWRVNKYVRHSLGPDYQFGHGYLNEVWKADAAKQRWKRLAFAWESDLLPQLEEFFRTRQSVLSAILLGEAGAPPEDIPSTASQYPYQTEEAPSGQPFEMQDPLLRYSQEEIRNMVPREPGREVLAYLALGEGPAEEAGSAEDEESSEVEEDEE